MFLRIALLTLFGYALIAAVTEGTELKGLRGSIAVLWNVFREHSVPFWAFSLVLLIAIAQLPELFKRGRFRRWQKQPRGHNWD
jgi:hypothetical protein